MPSLFLLTSLLVTSGPAPAPGPSDVVDGPAAPGAQDTADDPAMEAERSLHLL